MQQSYNLHSLTISPQLIQLKRKLIQPSVLSIPETNTNHIDTQKLKLHNLRRHHEQFNYRFREQQGSGLSHYKGQVFSQRKLKDSKEKSFIKRQRYILPPMKSIKPILKQQSSDKSVDMKQIVNSYAKKRFYSKPTKRLDEGVNKMQNVLKQQQMGSFINKSKVKSKGKRKVYYKPDQIRKKSSNNNIQINSFQQYDDRHFKSQMKLGAQIAIAKKKNRTLLTQYQEEYNFFQLQTQFNQQDYVTFEDIFARHKNLNFSSYHRVPTIPQQQDLKAFLRQYQPHCQDIIMKDLLKSNFCSYQYNNNQLYVGQMVGKVKTGKGILFRGDVCFEGHWKKNQITKGVQINKLGIYVGTFQNNLKNGQGELQCYNGDSYIGQWSKGLQNGKGLWINSRGQSYNGEWRNGKAEGIAALIIKNNHNTKHARKYKGAFVNNKQQGFGRQNFASGDTYEGLYKNDKPSGKGIYCWKNGSIYQGQFDQGLREGMGVLKTSYNLIYKGQFRNDRAEGQCEIILPNGDKYYGMVKNGKKNGKGTLYIQKSKQVYNGYWKNDYFVNFEDADEP